MVRMLLRTPGSTFLAAILLTQWLTSAIAQNAAPEPLEVVDMGSFHIGGRIVEITGKPVKEVVFTPGGVPAKVDPNGPYLVEQMYVQYFVPKTKRAQLPMLLWHGGSLTGVSYESTPDGREGWLNYFLRKGLTVYNSDAVERGRSGWTSKDIWPADPIFLTMGNGYERFRIGAGEGSWNADSTKQKPLPGVQFPVEAYDNWVRQVVPRWTTTDDATIAAYTALVDKVCPCIILVHSQAGQFGQKVAQARPDKVKALVLVEPAGLGFADKMDVLKDIPILTVYGDNIDRDARWPTIRKKQLDLLDKVTAAGGHVEIVNLPDMGIMGNSHLMMMDKNNMAPAGVILDWLARQGLWK